VVHHRNCTPGSRRNPHSRHLYRAIDLSPHGSPQSHMVKLKIASRSSHRGQYRLTGFGCSTCTKSPARWFVRPVSGIASRPTERRNQNSRVSGRFYNPRRQTF
jgi:hypothetical protein